MCAYDFTPRPDKGPETQPAFDGGPPQPPPRPPKLTARDLLDPDEPGKTIFVADYIEVQDLAELLQVKAFKVVAELLDLKIFAHASEWIDFSTAAIVANRHGFVAERLQ